MLQQSGLAQPRMAARHYDAQLGRFTSADTVTPLASQGVQAFDRYGYVNSNPLKYRDPSGHAFVSNGEQRSGMYGYKEYMQGVENRRLSDIANASNPFGFGGFYNSAKLNLGSWQNPQSVAIGPQSSGSAPYRQSTPTPYAFPTISVGPIRPTSTPGPQLIQGPTATPTPQIQDPPVLPFSISVNWSKVDTFDAAIDGIGIVSEFASALVPWAWIVGDVAEVAGLGNDFYEAINGDISGLTIDTILHVVGQDLVTYGVRTGRLFPGGTVCNVISLGINILPAVEIRMNP